MRVMKYVLKIFLIVLILIGTVLYVFLRSDKSNSLLASVYEYINVKSYSAEYRLPPIKGIKSVSTVNADYNGQNTWFSVYKSTMKISNIIDMYMNNLESEASILNFSATDRIGILRYKMNSMIYNALAVREEHGDYTTILVTVSPGELTAYMGDWVDVPGKDHAVIPRFPGSIRVMSWDSSGINNSTYIYKTVSPRGDITAFYDSCLEAKGWKSSSISNFGDETNFYQNDNSGLLISTEKDAKGGFNWITIVNMGISR